MNVIHAAGCHRILNWHPSLPTRAAPFAGEAPGVQSVTLIAKMPPIRDQKDLGACTAFSAEAPVWLAELNGGNPMPRHLAPLFQYYAERLLNGQVGVDSGATIADIYRALNRYGVCDESLWPYDPAKFTEQPPAAVFATAAQERGHLYAPVPLTIARITSCLWLGFPVDFGYVVYPSLEAIGADGMIPMPGTNEQALGGHANDIIGINATSQEDGTGIPPLHVMIRNSWSTLWGKQGYGFMPIDYAIDPSLASDGWMIRKI